MTYQYFLDESGNTGDLVKLPPDLKFADQPFFALSCIGINDCGSLDLQIEALKKKHKVQGDELKSKNLYKSKPKFILELFDIFSKGETPFYVEVVDKKYSIAVSIVNHQIIPPYFSHFPSLYQEQGLKNELSDYLSENMPVACYQAFFESCIDKTEVSLLKSLNTLNSYFRSREFNFKYKVEAQTCLKNTIRFYHDKKSNILGLLEKLIPIPDLDKKGKNINLLPHVHSWYNIMAKVNKKHKGCLKEVVFYHDQQDHFDDILLFCSEEMRKFHGSNQFDPTTDFNIKDKVVLEFPDSKKYSGIQLADVLAGYISRYTLDFMYSDEPVKNEYHDIFNKLKNAYSENNNFGVNFVLPISRRSKLFKHFDL